MAESLDYFFGLTDLSTGIIAQKWLYPAAGGSGNFGGASGGTPIYRALSGGSPVDFSLFFTYDKEKSTNNNKGSALLTNSYLSSSGFTFGINQNNYPFLRTQTEAVTFEDIVLGKKNTICLQRAGNTFSILQFDPASSGIVNTQTKTLIPNANINGPAPYYFGGVGNTTNSMSGVGGFYGTVDQLMFLTEKVAPNDALTIFSGFSNLSVVESTITDYTYPYEEWVYTNAAFNSGMRNHIGNYVKTAFTPRLFVTGLSFGQEYLSKLEFVSTTGVYNVTHYYGSPGSGFCAATGAWTQLGTMDNSLSNYSGLLPSSFTLLGNFALQEDSVFSTHVMSGYYSNPRFSYSALVSETVIGTPSANTGYYSSFMMQGVFAPQSESTLLARMSGTSFEVGLDAVFDSSVGLFGATGLPGGANIFFNGEVVKPTGYSFVDNYIDILNYTEQSSDSVIYDKVTNSGVLSTVHSSWATGDFFHGTSLVATGISGATQRYRLPKTDYIETHSYHLLHGNAWQESYSSVIYPNLDENWQ